MHLLVQETRDSGVPSLGREDPLEEDMPTHASVLPGESHGQRRLEGQSPQVTKRQTRLSVSSPYLGPNTCWVESANASHSQPLQLAEDPEPDGLRAEVKLKAQAQGEG